VQSKKSKSVHAENRGVSKHGKDVSAKKKAAAKGARFQKTDENGERAQNFVEEARQGQADPVLLNPP